MYDSVVSRKSPCQSCSSVRFPHFGPAGILSVIAPLAGSRAPLRNANRPAIALFVLLGMAAAASAADLSKYRSFEFGTGLPAVAKQAGVSPSLAKEIHRRPALIQELEWRPQPLGLSSKTESVKDVLFTFYEGELFRIVVNYDQGLTEGLTNEDVVEALSRYYGMAETTPTAAKHNDEPYEREDLLARWQDADFRFDLGRLPYGHAFRLTGVLKRLELVSEAAAVEARRLEAEDAPRKEAARRVSDEIAAKAAMEKARVANKPNFRP